MARRGRRRKLIKVKLKKDVVINILGLALVTLSAVLSLAMAGLGGRLLDQLAVVIRAWLGAGRWLVVPALLISGLFCLRLKRVTIYLNHLIGFWLFFVTFVVLFNQGLLGQLVRLYFSYQFGVLISLAVFGLGLISALMLILNLSFNDIINLVERVSRLILTPLGLVVKQLAALLGRLKRSLAYSKPKPVPAPKPVPTPQPVEPVKPTQPVKAKSSTAPTSTSLSSKPIDWKRPPTDLVSLTPKKPADRGDVKANAATIEKTLASFGIKAKVVRTSEGAAVTQYALDISAGTKLSKVVSLQNNLALALAAPQGRIRIEAPIPGESLVGIEVPNRTPELVPTVEILKSSLFTNHPSRLAFALGKDVSGRLQVADLTQMPHLLVAGATGSGKSVFLNNLIVSFLYKASPAELKMILVDPKRVELTLFQDLPYLITPVIKDADKVLSALKWAEHQMKERYKQLSEVGVRNIAEYHKLMGPTSMPYLVIIIDELAQVMLFSPNEVEKTITQLAQMARAVGIHLVLATQRPSVDIITGLIKANIPARISFYVTSGVDSKVILDSTGAEKLLGKGDMLYLPPDQAAPQRIQGAFVSTAEVKNVTSYIRERYSAAVDYQDEVLTAYAPDQSGGGSVAGKGQADPELIKAVEAAISYGEISVSLLQRRLRIGYNKAARLVEERGNGGPRLGSPGRAGSETAQGANLLG